jgi:hypothetical protein
MRKFLYAAMMFCITVGSACAQNAAVLSSLKSKYSLAQYHPEFGGWYFLSYQKSGQTVYGFADAQGNVVAADALKYKLHKGYIEFYMLDSQKKAEHDMWIQDKKQYEQDMVRYKQVNKAYEAEKEAYEQKVQVARTEAERRWNAERERVRRAAQAEADAKARQLQAQQQQQQSSSGLLGVLNAVNGALTAVNNGLSVSNAVNAVKFQPFFDQVKAERDLTVEPSAPYNPMPSEPREPDSGFYWCSYTLKQPCPYDYVEYSKISEVGGFAEVRKDKRYGLVDAYLNEVVPCTNRSSADPKWLTETACRVKTDAGYGILNANGAVVIPCQYSELEKEGSRYRVRRNGRYGLLAQDGTEIMPCMFDKMESSNGYLLCQAKSLWGIYTSNFEELYPCQYQQVEFSSINGKTVLNTCIQGLWGVIDFKNGQPILNNRFTKIGQLKLNDKESAFLVTLGGNKLGVYSDKGVIIIPAEYDEIKVDTQNYGRDCFEVKQGNTLGLYSTIGVPIIPTGKYKSIKKFDKGFFVGDKTSGDIGVLAASGQPILPCQYARIQYLPKMSAFFVKNTNGANTQCGLMSLTGEEIVPPVACESMEVSPDANTDVIYTIASGKKGNMAGAIDFNGKTLLPTTNKYVDAKSKAKFNEKVQKLCAKNRGVAVVKAEKKEQLEAHALRQSREMREYEANQAKFSYYAQGYVERVVNEWQIRGEYEKKDAWEKRVNADTRKQKVFELTKDAQRAYIENESKHLPADRVSIVGQYDPDNEVYRLHSLYSVHDLLVHVPTADAQEFKVSFDQMTKRPTFFIENDRLALAEYVFTMKSNGHQFKYSNQASLNYTIAQVNYNFDAIQIDQSSSNMGYKGGKQTISTTQLRIGTSDVDYGIPAASQQQPNTYALIIANENYSNEKNVDYAYNDGQVFRDYCVKALGIPEQNVLFSADATLNNMRFDLNWMKQIAAATKGNAKFVFYYAGHGMPDDNTKDAYLLPVDGFSSDVNSGYRLADIYAMMEGLPADHITVLLDACFSGAQRSGDIMASVRGVAVTPQVSAPSGNLLVFAAATGKETAQPYKDKQHGLFTYFLLKKLKEHQGTLTMGDLTDYVSTEVSKTALVGESHKNQTPNVTASPALGNWQQIQVR